MRSSECVSGGCKTRNGRLWFPTVKGAVVIDPAHISINMFPPPVLIEDVLADNVLLVQAAPGSRIDVPAGKEKLELHYTANSFVVPQRVEFKYRLEGFDEDWVDAGTARVAQYTHLPPREYTFRVIACNDDGIWNEKGARFTFTLLPHLWQRRWLQVVAAIGVLAGVLGVQRQRLDRRKTKELAERLRAADLERKTEELERARRVQLALLPKEPLRIGPWTVAGAMQTAAEVGGDYFGYLEARGRLGAVIADATGHGMASGLVAGMLKAVVANISQNAGHHARPAKWLCDLNDALRTSIAQRSLGICAGIALVDVDSCQIDCATAGVPHAFHVSASGIVERIALSGTPLGYLKKIVTAETARTLEPGDRFVLITDGLIEQVDAGGQEWDYAGVESALAVLCARDASPVEIAEGLLAACEAHGAGQPRSDDRTVVVLARSSSS